jgi:hypothetical protein
MLLTTSPSVFTLTLKDTPKPGTFKKTAVSSKGELHCAKATCVEKKTKQKKQQTNTK